MVRKAGCIAEMSRSGHRAAASKAVWKAEISKNGCKAEENNPTAPSSS